jgi:hypothetical protein
VPIAPILIPWVPGTLTVWPIPIALWRTRLGVIVVLPPEQQTERLDSFVSDVPPLNQPPLKGNLAYGLGLENDHGWIGHNGDIVGYNTYLLYHPELDAVVAVEVNSSYIFSGDCPEDVPTMKDGPQGIPCALPADRIFRALAEALGKPAPAPPQ